jgi:ABC-type transport system involved in cytochrome bd biosynthesis fused ATPase/permease subunit
MINSGGALDMAIYGVSTGGSMGAMFLFVRWLSTHIAARTEKKEAALEQSNQSLINNLKAEVDRLYQRMDSYEERLRKCHEQHAETQQELARMRGLMQARGEIRDRVQTQVAAERLRDKGIIEADDDGGESME